MFVKIKKRKKEPGIYIFFAIFLVFPIYVFITTPDGSQRLLALSVAVAIFGVIVSKWSFFRSLEKQKEESERPYKAAKDQIKSYLEDFVSVGSANNIILLGPIQLLKRQELQKEMTDVCTTLKTVIENIERLIILPSDISKEAKSIAKALIKLTPRISRSMETIVEEWDELQERAKRLIERLEQEEVGDR